MLHVNLPQHTKAANTSLSFLWRSLSTIHFGELSLVVDVLCQHNSSLVVVWMRYSGDLEVMQKKWGGQDLCFSLLWKQRWGGLVLNVSNIYFLNVLQISRRSHVQKWFISSQRENTVCLHPEIVHLWVGKKRPLTLCRGRFLLLVLGTYNLSPGHHLIEIENWEEIWREWMKQATHMHKS